MAAETDAVIAANRFGLGARPGDLRRIADDPRGAVAEQLGRRDAALLDGAELRASDDAIRAARAAELRREAERAAAPRPADRTAESPVRDGRGAEAVAGPRGTPAMDGRPTAAMEAGPKPAMAAKPPAPVETDIFRAELEARARRLVATDTPLVERLVLFWSNHFAVSVTKGNALRVSAGAMEREAIRPHVLGRFADMLRAVETHPAMLYYLDNHLSIGPRSRAARNGRRGLNENLAREILELHTLGVAGGYGQGDVAAFARVLTGWTVASPDDDAFHGGRFTFAPARHEPGEQTVLGRTYADAGHAQGFAVLDDLARHPSTARHVAYRLARHFVDDRPPEPLVARLAALFRATDGDLAAVTRALVAAPEAWRPEATKIRPPVEFVVAMLRALGREPALGPVAGALAALGQPPFAPPGPDGWPDTADAWQSPAGLATRLDLAVQFARAAGDRDPAALAAEIWGGALPEATRVAVRRAESRQQAVALLFAAPEFQRR